MKKPAILALLLAVLGGIVYAQEEAELELIGRYDDVHRIRNNFTKETDQFVFTRLIYNGRIPGYYKNWYTDYPRADRHLIEVLKRLTNINIADQERVVPINDPDLFKYPLIYSSEVEQMVLTDEDAAILRKYLERGGFWIVDDFWGSFEWSEFTAQMRKIFPNREIKNIPLNDESALDHPIFHVFYDIDHLIQTPSMAYAFNGGITWETDGFVPECKGIWDDNGRLMMVINHNTDLGDAYEWSDDPRYPNKFSGYAYRMAVNFIMYAMSH
jgi:Domain of unknown function (DUF4159)